MQVTRGLKSGGVKMSYKLRKKLKSGEVKKPCKWMYLNVIS